MSIPDDKDPENISMEEALVLIASRIAYDESKSGKKTTGRPSRDIRMSGPVRFVVDGFRTGIPVTDLPWHGMPSQPM